MIYLQSVQAVSGYTTTTGTVSALCTSGTSYTMGLNNGLHDANHRYVKGATSGALINYGVCQTNTPVNGCSGGTPWAPGNSKVATGTGLNQNFTMYAYIVNGYNYTPDTYADTETLSVSF